MVIAIDGPAGSGKSTIARLLAERLKLPKGKSFTYINSGNLYRAICLGCLRAGISPVDPVKALEFAKNASIEYRNKSVFLGGEDVTALLHTDEIDQHTAPLSAIVPIRHVVNDIIRKIAADCDAVVEGRDMTTVVFPDAKYRFYLDASADARAMRRKSQGVSQLGLEEIKEAILKRDEIDRNKTEGSLKIAPGVDYMDTSDLTIDQVYAKLEGKIQLEGNSMAQKEVGSDTNLKDGGAKTQGPKENIQTTLQEEYLKNLENLEEGQLIEGYVIQVTSDQVFINIGYKSEGKIPITEFTEIPKEGEKVQVILEKMEDRHGEVVVSKQKADVKIFWKNLRQAFQDHTMIEGTIEKLVKGGYDVNLGAGVHAFLPISQSDAQKVDKPEKLLELKSPFYVERLYSDGKVNIVVNRRKWIEEEIEQKRSDFFANTQIGADVTGEVKSFTSFGAFIDLGGFDGLLHINDMSWGHVTRPKDFVRKGQEIRLKVIRIDPAEKRINLSLKHFTDDPWVHFEDKYHVNDVVKGKVTKLTDFGAFIELEEGIEGLAHISEFSWIKKIQKPEEVVSIGDEVECMVLGYDLQQGKVSLGLKQVTANPWNEIGDKYPVGTRLTRKVVKLTNAGAFIELEDGIDGFLHGDDISWTKKVKHPGSEIQVGQEIEIMVIRVEKDSRNIKLGIKQLSEDPWQSFAATYKPGTLMEGEVSSITDFGIFVRVPGGIEGLIHKTNLPENREETPEDALKKYHVGDKIKAVVLEIQSDKQKVAFSIRDYQKKVQQDELSHYMAGEESDGDTYTLGDFLKSRDKDTAEGAGE
ncbi:30S ribosomal protein S1 [Leadbettera azotonutricia]|uniref:Cytidylate kinase n=1 Tax=Leadbettera azotonutricia (strain ATCC BAA-888 / DSM 13862 / ZAS-9) TaxID=545695 RepID=F5YC65_LEAAZ|nr:30S ribosomal protein S1 [Leadbettera azotonutricia]AEF83469.1 cytidylate kinase/ribosomal protein S1 [Leadbettera azotonutricia ZAS-9]